MSTVLSTKKLTSSQKQLLLNSGLGFVEYDAIKIKLLSLPVNTELEDNLILTSKNAARVLIKEKNKNQLDGLNFFCVGEKTKNFLESKGLKVVESAHYGADIAQTIAAKYKNSSFTYLCGNMRRDELPYILKDDKVKLEEVEVYSTSLNYKKFQQQFDAVLFYSPSGIQSFCSVNELKETTAICIGKTTALEAEKYSENIITATKPSIENVIVQAVKLLGKTALDSRGENI